MQNNANNPAKYLLILLIAIIVFIAGFQTSKIEAFYKVGNKVTGYQVSGDLKSEKNDVKVDLLWEVWDTLEREYIDPDEIDGQELLYGAANGLVEGLGDKYTNFLTPEEKQDYLSSNKREFQGIGTTLAEDEGAVIIETPVDGSPAQRAGLKPNDIILKVDGDDVQGKSVTEVASMIRGDANTKVRISYYRPSANETTEVEIVREVINLDILETKDLGDGITMLKIYQFTDESVEVFNREWDREISKIVNSNPKGIVIDLRNNPGGFVDAVRYTLGEFLPQGTIVFQEETRTGKRTSFKVNRSGKMQTIPLVVLVNEGSASSSEIFAGAIQDNERGKIIGTETVGKGVEQRLVNLSDGSMLQVVFQKWLTPKGRNISVEEPITPDFEEKEPEDQLEKAIELLK